MLDFINEMSLEIMNRDDTFLEDIMNLNIDIKLCKFQGGGVRTPPLDPCMGAFG